MSACPVQLTRAFSWNEAKVLRNDIMNAVMSVVLSVRIMVLVPVSVRGHVRASVILAVARVGRNQSILCIQPLATTEQEKIEGHIQQKIYAFASRIGSVGKVSLNWLEGAGSIPSHDNL